MHTAFISIGSNSGDRRRNIESAMDSLRTSSSIEVVRVSSLYETKPDLPEGAAPQPDFLNGAVEVRTDLSPKALLSFISDIEISQGRPKKRRKNEPRAIDLDILLFDDLVMDTDELTIPHPMMAKRMFVLKPLCDIAPSARHPVLRMNVREMMAALEEGT